jgi:uncharacterized protein YukE
MKADKLASFRVDSQLWEQFQAIAKENNNTASALLVGYIKSVVNPDNAITSNLVVNTSSEVNLSIHDIDSRIDAKISQSIQDINTPSIQNIENLIDSRIGGSIADGDIKGAIAHSYQSSVDQFNGHLEELQNQIREFKKQLEELQSVPPSAAPIPPSADISPAIDNSPAPADNSPIVSIDELQLSTNSYNLIKREQINTVGDLLSYSEDDLLSIKGFGDVALNEVKDAMKRRIGLDFPQICNDQLKIPRATIENIRKTLIRKAITVSTKQIRKAFKDSGWNGSNYQEIREDVIKLLSNG